MLLQSLEQTTFLFASIAFIVSDAFQSNCYSCISCKSSWVNQHFPSPYPKRISIELHSTADASLTPEQLELVQSSWEKVKPIEDAAADIFYTKMFTQEPSYRELFSEDMTKQKKDLMKMLGMAVNGITNLEELVPKVQDLGRRHAQNYKVTVPMYKTVGECLLYTLEQGLGDSWTQEHKEAWSLTYQILAGVMIETHEE